MDFVRLHGLTWRTPTWRKPKVHVPRLRNMDLRFSTSGRHVHRSERRSPQSIRGRDAQRMHTVARRQTLLTGGWTSSGIDAQLRAGRWQRAGRAIVLHNGPLTRGEVQRAGLLNCGPQALFTSFTSAELAGLENWLRDEVHILAPVGTKEPRIEGVPIRLHRTHAMRGVRRHRQRPAEMLPGALVRAAASFTRPRPAAGLYAAVVQQGLARVGYLRSGLLAHPTARHRRMLLAALHDIEMGSHALSEIDFIRLCRRYRLPAPLRQAVRSMPNGQRRYLDALWRLRNGRTLAAEVDGAIHLRIDTWVSDQLRQNEVLLTGTPTLRFPSIVFRTDPARVADQLRRGLGL